MSDPKRDTIDTATTSWLDGYRRLTEVVIPRPIALVATVDPNGVPNLAPFSFFTIVSSNPPFIAFAPHRMGRTGSKKGWVPDGCHVHNYTIVDFCWVTPLPPDPAVRESHLNRAKRLLRYQRMTRCRGR